MARLLITRLIFIASLSGKLAAAPVIWHGAGDETQSAAAFLYDPATRSSIANPSSSRLSKAEKIPLDALDLSRGFTLEAVVKIDTNPYQNRIVASLDGHGIGVHFLRQWGQTYWAGFSSSTARAAMITGAYPTNSRLREPKPGADEGNLDWRHLALVYNAEKQTLSVWQDRWQVSEQPLSKALTPPEALTIAGDFPGLIDVVKLTPAALDHWQFLLPSAVRLRDVGLEPQADRYPLGAGHIDLRACFGLIGDGVHDNTAAFQRAMNEIPANTIAYLPNGSYLVSDTVSWPNFRLLVGESRESTVIRLKDHATAYAEGEAKPVLRCHYNQNESIMNFIQHLTVDTGRGNAGAIGIRYNAHNQGALENVTIRSGDGLGAIGLDLSETEFGPALIREVLVEGFDIGIKTPGNVSHATMEDITVRGQQVVGLENGLPMSLLGFTSENSVPAIVNSGWMAQLTLLDSKLTGGSPKHAAIELRGGASGDFRRIETTGYGVALRQETEDGNRQLPAGRIESYLVGETKNLFGDTTAALDLRIEQAPPMLQQSASKWLLVPPPASEDDDCTAMLQAALDSGSATICLTAHATYRISASLRVPPTVRRIHGMKAVLRAPSEGLENAGAILQITGGGREVPPLHIEHLGTSFHPARHYSFEIDTARDVAIRWSSGLLRNTAKASGKLFIDEQMGWIHLDHPQRAWIRQLDTESRGGRQAKTETYLRNNGGTVWVLGMKTEHVGLHAETSNGGRTEILGGFFRDHSGSEGIPYFRTIDAQLSANYFQFAHVAGATRRLQAEETQNGELRRWLVESKNKIVGRYRAGKAGGKNR